MRVEDRGEKIGEESRGEQPVRGEERRDGSIM